MNRPKICKERLEYILDTVSKRAHLLYEKRKSNVWCTPQEALGVITEEYHEFVHAVHDNDRSGEFAELLDISVAAVYAMASYDSMERWDEQDYPYTCVNCGKTFNNPHPLVTHNCEQDGTTHREIFCCPACEDNLHGGL